MKELIIGTGNPAKKILVRAALAPLNLEIKGTDDFDLRLDIEENGHTALENARKKSLAYAQTLNRSVLSIDNALYLDGLSDDEQPGLDTRSVPGYAGRATDEQLLKYYSEKIRQLGQYVTGRWEYGVCLATPDGQFFETTFDSPRIFVAVPSPRMITGFPLESLQLEPVSGRYVSEMSQAEQDAFWQKIVGQPLCTFVQSLSY